MFMLNGYHYFISTRFKIFFWYLKRDVKVNKSSGGGGNKCVESKLKYLFSFLNKVFELTKIFTFIEASKW